MHVCPLRSYERLDKLFHNFYESLHWSRKRFRQAMGGEQKKKVLPTLTFQQKKINHMLEGST